MFSIDILDLVSKQEVNIKVDETYVGESFRKGFAFLSALSSDSVDRDLFRPFECCDCISGL